MLSAKYRKSLAGFGFCLAALSTAVFASSTPALAHLRLARFVPPMSSPQQGLTAAILDHDLTRTTAILRSGVRPDRGLIDGRTILQSALPSVTICRMLIDAGAPVNQRDAWGRTALMSAAARRDVIAMRMLLDHGADVSPRTATGWTALALACGSDSEGAVKLLIEHHADANTRLGSGRTVLANVLDHPNLVRLLLEGGADPNIRYSEPGVMSTTPLIDAVANGRLETSELLLSHGAEVNATDASGETPLILAAQGTNVEMVRMLVSHHADVRLADRNGATAIAWARYDHNRPMLAVLSRAGQRVARG